MTKQRQFVELAHNEVINNSLYLWGGQGESVLTLPPEQVILAETSLENAGRTFVTLGEKLKKKIAMKNAKYFDCSGLVVWCLTKLGLITGDYTANDIYNKLCYAIPKEKLKGGDLCFKSTKGRMTHVAIYSKSYGVIEAKGRDYGVVEGKFDESKWSTYGRLRCLEK
ncbi:MAG: C40 family peptidase [Clostridia bacterium]|nr:C40 family peptidase [Clostridia bacterium]